MSNNPRSKENNNVIIEYIWLDGYETPNIRSKIRVVKSKSNTNFFRHPYHLEVPMWGFDGSSTGQATGHNSDCILNPVMSVISPHDPAHYIVLCEVFNEKQQPHTSNYRNKLADLFKTHKDKEIWISIEQEYFIYEEGPSRPLGWPIEGLPNPQGRYYCGVGGDVSYGRDISNAHLKACLVSGLDISGTNAEVAPGQWEFQIGPSDPLDIADQLWMARFILNKIAERQQLNIRLDPKPIIGDWNGSGAHINFSTKEMRTSLDYDDCANICNQLKDKHKEHIEVYGHNNSHRLTGHHETCNINEFKFGIADRGASIRIPLSTYLDKKGYLEDRRPAANMDPYKACAALLETICQTPVLMSV